MQVFVVAREQDGNAWLVLPHDSPYVWEELGAGVTGAAGLEATVLADEGRELEAAHEEVEALHGWKGANVHRWIAQRLVGGGSNDAMQDK